MELNGVHYRKFNINRLYFKYIRETELEKLGVTTEKLSDELERLKLISITDDRKNYIELPNFTKNSGTISFKKLWQKPNGLLSEFYLGLRKS